MVSDDYAYVSFADVFFIRHAHALAAEDGFLDNSATVRLAVNSLSKMASCKTGGGMTSYEEMRDLASDQLRKLNDYLNGNNPYDDIDI